MSRRDVMADARRSWIVGWRTGQPPCRRFVDTLPEFAKGHGRTLGGRARHILDGYGQLKPRHQDCYQQLCDKPLADIDERSLMELRNCGAQTAKEIVCAIKDYLRGAT